MNVRELKILLADIDDNTKVNVIMDGVIDPNPELNCDGETLYIEAVSQERG